MTVGRRGLVIALGMLLMLPPHAWAADGDANGSERPRREAPAPALRDDDVRRDRDNPTDDALERWDEDDRQERRDERTERRERRRIEKGLDEHFPDAEPAD